MRRVRDEEVAVGAGAVFLFEAVFAYWYADNAGGVGGGGEEAEVGRRTSEARPPSKVGI